jgi:predicted DNA-binding transcriptional regulator AlpA
MTAAIDSLMTLGEAAKMFRLSERSVARLRRRDHSFPAEVRLPGVRRVLFDRGAVLEYLRNLTCTPLGEVTP